MLFIGKKYIYMLFIGKKYIYMLIIWINIGKCSVILSAI